jgi:hypothetical protein
LRSVAVLQWRWHPQGKTVHVYSSTGRRLSTVTPKGQPLGVAVSGRNLVVLERDGELALYDARTGSLRRTFNLPAKELPKRDRPGGNPKWLQALAVQGNIAVYSKPVRYLSGGTPRESAIHALNLSTGADRAVGWSRGQIPLAQSTPEASSMPRKGRASSATALSSSRSSRSPPRCPDHTGNVDCVTRISPGRRPTAESPAPTARSRAVGIARNDGHVGCGFLGTWIVARRGFRQREESD